MENLKKNWWIITFLIGIVVSAGTYVYKDANEKADIKTRIFPDNHTVVRATDHLEAVGTPAQIERARIMDSINTADAIRSRSFRDSLMKLEYVARKKSDSISTLNADQMFQIKKILKSKGVTFTEN